MKLPFHKLNKYLTASCFLLANVIISHLSGDPTSTSGIWINPVQGNWDVPANWLTTNPSGVYPNGNGDVAAFIGNLAGPATINSSNTITLGSLNLVQFSGNPPITFSFTNSHFNFSAGSNQIANIQVSGLFVMDTPIHLHSPLDITTQDDSDFIISQPISGPKQYEVSIDGGFASVTYTAENTYLGVTNVSGALNLNCLAGPSIVGDILINGGSLNCQADNQFADSTNFTVIGESFLSFDAPNQRLNSFKIKGVSTFDPKAFTLLAPKGEHAFIAQLKEGDCSFSFGSIIFENYGSMFLSDGVGVFNAFEDSFDLNNGSVDLIVGVGNLLANAVFESVTFTNGILNIKGTTKGIQSKVRFSNLTSIPKTNVTDASVRLGFDPNGVINVNPPGSRFSLLRNSSLLGVGTIGTSGSANVFNIKGTISPGFDGNTMFGTEFSRIIISGNYTQKAHGTLVIKIGIGESDQLIVQDGSVKLDGTLRLPTFTNIPNVGDVFTILDNTVGSTGPITGKFSRVITNFPAGLYADVTYNTNTVAVTIKSGCPSK